MNKYAVGAGLVAVVAVGVGVYKYAMRGKKDPVTVQANIHAKITPEPVEPKPVEPKPNLEAVVPMPAQNIANESDDVLNISFKYEGGVDTACLDRETVYSIAQSLYLAQQRATDDREKRSIPVIVPSEEGDNIYMVNYKEAESMLDTFHRFLARIESTEIVLTMVDKDKVSTLHLDPEEARDAAAKIQRALNVLRTAEISGNQEDQSVYVNITSQGVEKSYEMYPEDAENFVAEINACLAKINPATYTKAQIDMIGLIKDVDSSEAIDIVKSTEADVKALCETDAPEDCGPASTDETEAVLVQETAGEIKTAEAVGENKTTEAPKTGRPDEQDTKRLSRRERRKLERQRINEMKRKGD